MDDKQILLLLWNRMESAIPAMARAFGKRLQQTAMNILGLLQDAEECVNDTYLAVWNAVPPKRPEPLAPYVYRTGRNIALKRLRADSAARRCCAYDVSLDELADCIPGGNLEDLIHARALGRAIDQFLSRQSRMTRVIFLRRYWYGDSVRSIAEDLNMQESAVSVRLHRTREKLRQFLIREGMLYEAADA